MKFLLKVICLLGCVCFLALLQILLFNHWVVSDSLRLHRLQHARLPCWSLSPGVCSNSCPLSWWCHPTISSSVIPFAGPQSCPASGSFPMNRFFTSSGQSIEVSASAFILPMNIQGWFHLGLTDFITFSSRDSQRVFYNTTNQKHQFFGAQPSLWYNSHIHIWLLEKPCQQGDVSAF